MTNAGDAELEAAGRSPQKRIRRDMTVRQVAHDFPACRRVFARYGEPADRRPFGHLEPLDRFAERRRVPLDRLLRELSDAAGVPVDLRGPAAEHVHRPFLAAALAITLTIGAGWGAWLLWRIGLQADFSAAPARYVVAHGDAQLWGFVALFITGVALRWLPMATGARPVDAAVARSILIGLLSGVAAGFLWALWPGTLGVLGPLSGVALFAATVAAVGCFFRAVAGRLREPWAWGVLAAGCWWAVWAGFVLWLRFTHRAAGPDAYSAAQRNWSIELAVFGLAVNAVYGFGLRLLPGVVGGSVKRRPASLAIALHNVGLLLLAFGHATSQPVVELVATMCVAAAAGAYAAALPGLRRPKEYSNRPEQGPPGLPRYVQLAVFWLVAGACLLLGGHAYSVVSGLPAPRAWRGAARHALTVGFLTTMMMGVGQRLAPVLERRLLAWPGLVTPTLILVGAGNVLRVTTELAALAGPLAFSIMPVSSLLELAAITLFAANCFRTMWPRDPLLTTGRATPRSSVAVLLAEHPWLEDEFLSNGFAYLARTRCVPRQLTIASMCRSHAQDPERVVRRINERLRRARSGEAASRPRPAGPAGESFPGVEKLPAVGGLNEANRRRRSHEQ